MHAHVHWNWGDHDAHSDSSPAEDDEHDSDAMYAGATQFLNDGRSGEVANPELSMDCLIVDAANNVEDAAANSILRSRQPAPESLRPKCARYLQLLSIRC